MISVPENAMLDTVTGFGLVPCSTDPDCKSTDLTCVPNDNVVVPPGYSGYCKQSETVSSLPASTPIFSEIATV